MISEYVRFARLFSPREPIVPSETTNSIPSVSRAGNVKLFSISNTLPAMVAFCVWRVMITNMHQPVQNAATRSDSLTKMLMSA
ncbi:hypothetical protein SeMB42_g03897 [Synchytrium endobioticum]|uniref:Uncharacterized protein n=1 Tax=Synchytrium endobioticum TaxID=286115 RepID=A0A507D3A1_9FUNG|nr:hypothetical protein SeMB42_g03897 [Synchytrium endobioticum]